jgi:hypothetical protein
VLLAGRFIVSRAALLARPLGPVPGLDLSCGEPVSIELRPAGDHDHDGLLRRCERWNALALAGPAVREVRQHLGRSVVCSDPLVDLPRDGAWPVPRDMLAAQGATLGAALDRAGLGIAPGPPELVLGPAGPLLRRAPIWPADPARSLERVLAHAVVSLLGALTERAHDEPVPSRPRRPIGALRGELASRRVRVTCAVAAAAACALIGSSLLSGSHGVSPGVARASARPATPLVPRAALRAPVAAAPTRAPARARGGGARILYMPPARHARAASLVRAPKPSVARPATVRPDGVRPPGWVDGLVVGP